MLRSTQARAFVSVLVLDRFLVSPYLTVFIALTLYLLSFVLLQRNYGGQYSMHLITTEASYTSLDIQLPAHKLTCIRFCEIDVSSCGLRHP